MKRGATLLGSGLSSDCPQRERTSRGRSTQSSNNGGVGRFMAHFFRHDLWSIAATNFTQNSKDSFKYTNQTNWEQVFSQIFCESTAIAETLTIRIAAGGRDRLTRTVAAHTSSHNEISVNWVVGIGENELPVMIVAFTFHVKSAGRRVNFGTSERLSRMTDRLLSRCNAIDPNTSSKRKF